MAVFTGCEHLGESNLNWRSHIVYTAELFTPSRHCTSVSVTLICHTALLTSSGGSRISERGGAKDEAPQAPRFSRRRREDRGAEGAEVERRRREDRGAEGAEGGGVWEGMSPSPLGEGSGEGAVPHPQKFF